MLEDVRIGKLLPNGAVVLAKDGNMVFALSNGEFVSWKLDLHGNAFFGHYYGDCLVTAVKAYNDRRIV